MGATRHLLVLRNVHRHSAAAATAFALFFFFFFFFIATASSLALSTTQLHLEDKREGKKRALGSEVLQQQQLLLSRRRLGGPGSSPPTCRSKCGRCLPCKPVHVPIQPGRSMPLEYYPEAWRCKCGNKLFMP